MQFSAQEEYGLRCLLRLAARGGDSMTIPEISQAEGISVPYVAKLMRLLRDGGIVTSERGHSGGYRLAKPAAEISAAQGLAALGSKFYGGEFCDRYSGNEDECTHTTNCSIRSLWQAVQNVVDQLLSSTTIADLSRNEEQMNRFVDDLVVLTAGPDSTPIQL
jgi:Rrf2 family protein